jgi:hypothetical protein
VVFLLLCGRSLPHVLLAGIEPAGHVPFDSSSDPPSVSTVALIFSATTVSARRSSDVFCDGGWLMDNLGEDRACGEQQNGRKIVAWGPWNGD